VTLTDFDRAQLGAVLDRRPGHTLDSLLCAGASALYI
jgi:hypothetical protein